MVKALFDTNILIDHLNGVAAARKEFARHSELSISIITWIEVMVGAPAQTEKQIRAFLAAFELIQLNAQIADRVVALRRAHKIKLPDAIVWASAQHGSALLVTRNTKDFPANDPGVRHPYTI
jgi:predicted nucleic acid-binding protein